ncbi:MAG: rhamnulokinase family protein [Gemmatimonadaceae bacterium]
MTLTPRSPSPVPSYIAIDLGASSGRVVVGTLEGATMAMREVHRFRTPLVEEGTHLRWDIEALWSDVRLGIAHALDAAPAARSISVDSWAVDYVPLDAEGTPVRRPYAYRDLRTRGRAAQAVALIGADALYATTGIQFLDINTLPQVLADIADEPALVARTASRLLIADFLLYRLSGHAVAERTIASTTQLYDVHTGTWARTVIDAIADDAARWPRIVAPGTVLGPVVANALPPGVIHRPLVVATCSHDTAAAVAAIPADAGRPWAFISSGTWSLVGRELPAPVLTTAARTAGFTNEAGLDHTIRFLKNRTGMWVLEECIREWAAAGDRLPYDMLMAAAAASDPGHHSLDLDAPEFGERGGMPGKITAACVAHGVAFPTSQGAIVRLILESLAESYRRTLGELETLTGERADVVHVVGGGARSALLNQLTADACGRPVVAGPDEATSLGNLLIQARALGDLPAGVTVRDAARRTARVTEYAPRRAPAARPVRPPRPLVPDTHP